MLLALPLLLALVVDAAPPQTPPAPGQPKAVKRSLASTTWPVEPAFNAGFLASDDGLLPFVGVTIFVPVWPGLGPALVARGSATQLGALSFYEGLLGVGAVWEGRLESVLARLTLTPAVLASGFNEDSGESGLSLGPALLLPLDLALPLGNGIAFTASVEPGLSRRIVHAVDGDVVGRDRVFVFVGAGLTFGGPPSEEP